jgi:hemoglobin
MTIPLDSLCSLLGEEKIRALTAAFYRRVRADAVLSPLYPAHDWEGAEHRLASFLVYRFGGPATYLEERGHPRLRMRHLPFAIGPVERDQWLRLMGEALQEVEIPEAAAQAMMPFFAQVAEMMRNRAE